MEIVRIDAEIMGGQPCFAGTRVPVQTLVDYIKAGDSLEFFLSQHETVERTQAEAFLQASADALVKQAA